MISGHGDIASVLTDRPDRLYFASGVSNSQEIRESEYQREKDLLTSVVSECRDRQLVYFGTLAVFYSDTRYTRHKLEMEAMVKELPHFAIMRLGNITWGTNPHTLINTLRNQMKEGEPIEIRDTYRYVVEKDEFLHWVNLIPTWNCEMNVTAQRMKVSEIVKKYVL
jgi:nucleoside-diphosphate-sugar epimerase